VCAAVTVVLYDPRLAGLTWLALVVPLACAGLAMVGTIANAVSGGIGSRSSLTPLLVVPVSVPILLAAAQATEGLRAGAGILRWVLLLAAVDIVLAMAGVLTARPLEDM
jgi:heme exporter protein B